MMEFVVEEFSQLAEMTGGVERRGEESSLVVTDFVGLSHGSSACAGCAHVLDRIWHWDVVRLPVPRHLGY